MEVKVNSNFKKALRDIGNVPRKYVQKAMVTALNKVGAEVVTQAKRELRDATGLKAGVVGKKIKKDKARKGDETYSIHIKSRYLNAIEFGARQTKKGVWQRYGASGKITKELSLLVEEAQASSWCLRNLNAIQKELKQFMVLRYQESLNDKTWQRYLIRKLKHGSQFYLNGQWNFKC